MTYGKLPKNLGICEIDGTEMLLYQYMPIKLVEEVTPSLEERLNTFQDVVGKICCDFIGQFGLDRYINSYVYITVKRKYLKENDYFNRAGWHSDGFLTDDINYIWCDKNPTIFNSTEFELSSDDVKSMKEMTDQSKLENDFVFPEKTLLRLDQFNIHRVDTSKRDPVIRTFLKVSFSKDKYDLEGNTKNYLLDYNWKMRKRGKTRNIPQKLK